MPMTAVPATELAADGRAVVVLPTYDNAATLGAVLDGVAALGLPMIVVNDGSTDGTADLLRRRAQVSDGSLQVRTHPRNQGKAAALRTGFAAARSAGFTHAVTIDTDGQHDPADIPALLAAAQQDPAALVIGTRDESAEGYPRRSRVGRRISNLMVRIESGVRVADSQCGLRVYPLALVESARCRAGHFGFETEIITCAGWVGADVIGVPVSCRYLPPGQRVSHLRPWRDTFRGIAMHARLTARMLAPWPMPRGASKRTASVDETPRLTPAEAWRRMVRWLSPVRAWREVRDGGVGRKDFAAGFAVGVFIANLPLYGVQTLVSLYLARRLHLHPLSVVAGSQVSTPPIGPTMAAAAIALGHAMLHGSLPEWSYFDPTRAGWAAVVGPVLLEWTLGAVVLGAGMAVVAFVLADYACRAVGGLAARAAAEDADAVLPLAAEGGEVGPGVSSRAA